MQPETDHTTAEGVDLDEAIEAATNARLAHRLRTDGPVWSCECGAGGVGILDADRHLDAAAVRAAAPIIERDAWFQMHAADAEMDRLRAELDEADDAVREAIHDALGELGFDVEKEPAEWERVIATLAHEAVRVAAPVIAAPIAAERDEAIGLNNDIRAERDEARAAAVANVTKQADTIAALRARLADAEQDALTRAADAFTEHYLSNVECDHERGMDRPWCACSLVDLGWHPSVGDAVKAWRDHVMSVLRERAKAVKP